jgi:hypothetical protein
VKPSSRTLQCSLSRLGPAAQGQIRVVRSDVAGWSWPAASPPSRPACGRWTAAPAPSATPACVPTWTPATPTRPQPAADRRRAPHQRVDGPRRHGRPPRHAHARPHAKGRARTPPATATPPPARPVGCQKSGVMLRARTRGSGHQGHRGGAADQRSLHPSDQHPPMTPAGSVALRERRTC